MPGPLQTAVVSSPGTIGNFGPGFDCFSLAIRGCGDRIELAKARDDALVVDRWHAEGVPQSWTENAATRTLDRLRKMTDIMDPLAIRIRKGAPAGSGLGSSAASAGGAALAFHALFPEAALAPEQLVEAAAADEGGQQCHYDDVAAVIMGGLAMARVRNGQMHLTRIQPPPHLYVAILLPDVALSTEAMRALLPVTVDRASVVQQVGDAAALVDAFHRGEVEALGSCFQDLIAMPSRQAHVPFFDGVRSAAMDAGATGVALSGSGPAMAAICRTPAVAQSVADAMERAIKAAGFGGRAWVAEPEREVMHHAVALR